MLQNKAFILGLVVIVFITGGLMYIYNPTPTEYKNPKVEPVACTEEAMLCPDGSYVGREGPNCEFALCPTTSAQSTSTNTTIEAKTKIQLE